MNIALRYDAKKECPNRRSDPAKGAEPHGDDDIACAALFYPQIREWLPVAGRIGLPLASLATAAARSTANGSDVASELIAARDVDETVLYKALAYEAGLPFVEDIDPHRIVLAESFASQFLRRHAGHVPVKVQGRDGEEFPVVAPEGWSPQRFADLVGRYPKVVSRLKVTSPTALRSALRRRAESRTTRQAVGGLFERGPEFSARVVLNAWQGAVCGALMVALPLAFISDPAGSLLAIHYVSTFFFLACVGLRFAAIASAFPRRTNAVVSLPYGRKPVYSVLVALYKEADIVPGLLAALDRIVWPRSRLQVMLVCERDDRETIEAIRRAGAPPHVEIVEVPFSLPRTKPKALSYAMALARGDLIVLYDAEDEPHPNQLVEAWQKFSRSPPGMACLQAPLEIIDSGGGFLSRMFAFEYRALFGGLLPWLARHGCLLPLGGTSNHFRRTALEKVGGWDPFNVTEDADLGVRLARFGYRTEMLSLPTREPPPPDLAAWLPQRTRWLKGWLQTWLVHMRQPLRLARELGPNSFIAAQILFAGMVVSALVHPLLVVTLLTIVLYLAAGGIPAESQSVLLLIDVVNIACGYASFLLLGRQTLRASERRGFWKIVVFTPAYWLMVSYAAWRALIELWRRPHHWNKTPHPQHAMSAMQATEQA